MAGTVTGTHSKAHSNFNFTILINGDFHRRSALLNANSRESGFFCT
ncbi:hypothetical protein GLGR_1911 [Leminorella grimontii ATCC 33999 = DSM 5078]|nr:hypothetical protein GLGR_1911 [Leminorella grimontii ATCC 33999 = DSM 5078]